MVLSISGVPEGERFGMAFVGVVFNLDGCESGRVGGRDRGVRGDRRERPWTCVPRGLQQGYPMHEVDARSSSHATSAVVVVFGRFQSLVIHGDL